MAEKEKKELVCAACGEVFEPYYRHGVYCQACKKLSAVLRSKMRTERELALYEAEEAATRRKPKGPFDTTYKDLRRIDAECKLFGISYGKYTAACREGTIEKLLKAKGFKNPRKMLKELDK